MRVHAEPIRNTFTPDYSLAKQERLGICDWKVSDDSGREAFGHSRKEAEENYAKLAPAAKAGA